MKNTIRWILIIMILLIFFNCKKSPVEMENPPAIQTIGITTHTLNIGANKELQYAMSLPDNYSQGQAVPLIISLHYGGPNSPGRGEDLLRILVYPALKNLNAIIIAPDSLNGTWYESGNESAVLQLVSYIKSEYNIDSNRTLVTGYSMGGTGTWHFAANYPEIFKLGIPIACKPNQQSLSQWGEAPLFVIHGKNDSVFPLSEIITIVNQLILEGKPISFKYIDDLGHSNIEVYVETLRETISWIQANW